MNYDKYIGLPYQNNGRDITGIDCWGLARLFYKNELNIDLPSYVELYDGSYDPKAVAAINYYKDNWTKVEAPQTGDLCLFNIMGEPSHVGVYLTNNKFLHSRDGKDSVIEALDSPMWFKRLVGFYRYTEKSPLAVYGSPHPLQWNQAVEFAQPGTNCQAFANYIATKYSLSSGFAKQLIITINGIPVPQDRWNTTYFEKDQVVNYKIVAQGRQGARTLATIAVIIAAYYFGGMLGKALFGTPTAATIGGIDVAVISTPAWAKVAGTLAIQFAGMALVNAAFPIRPPKDPGQAIPTNMFAGTQNQANPFGGIPVVLGKTRVTGLLGATPYLETLSTTSLLHLIIIWGFGPLWVDTESISVGSTKITSLYHDRALAYNRPVQFTLAGTDVETSWETKTFNEFYPSDVQQLPASPVELINNSTTGNPWTTVTFTQLATNIRVAINFPEGLRMINTESGNSYAHTVKFAVAVYPSTFGDPGSTTDSSASQNIKRYSVNESTIFSLTAPGSISIPGGDGADTSLSLYRKWIIALEPNAGLRVFPGSVSDVLGNTSNYNLTSVLEYSSYSSLLGIQNSLLFEPAVPSNCLKLHEIIMGPGGTFTHNSFLGSFVNQGTVSGLTLTHANEILNGEPTGGKLITIASGYIESSTTNSPAIETDELIFSGRTDLPNAVAVTNTSNVWANEFLRNNAVWASTTTTDPNSGQPNTNLYIDQTNVVFPYSGYYTIDLAADNWAEVYINNIQQSSTANSFKEDQEGGIAVGTVRNQVFVSAGTYPVKVVGRNRSADAQPNPSLQNSNRGVACVIRFYWDGVYNVNLNRGWELKVETRNEKDGFNVIYDFPNLPRDNYIVRVKRLTADNTSAGKTQFAHKAYLYAITASDTTVAPLNPLPTRTWTNILNDSGTLTQQITNKRNLARTAITVQSTNKVNGTLEGVNALVQTMALDWDTDSDTWILRKTSNPASLFRYVLQHTANTYPVSDNELNLPALQEWHEFCNQVTTIKPKFEYNNVLNSTQSLMEVLKDIAAAGMASPTFVNGKWSVVVDKPRSYTVQHFTPHNSWGFSSTKSLVFIPDAFRISFPNEVKAYQADEVVVYNYGYAETNGYIVTAPSFISGNTYKITYLGNTNWTAIGYNGTPQIGGTFVKNGTAATGLGRAFSTQTHTVSSTVRQVEAAQKFEQLSLPGVTNANQVRHFARWHLAQLKLRPEIYTINADFEYLVCTRGDLVKVTHDVPLWGSGSARIKSATGVDNKVIFLTEKILFNSSKVYHILIRKNPASSPSVPGITAVPTVKATIVPAVYNSVLQEYEAATTSDYYDIVKITTVLEGTYNYITTSPVATTSYVEPDNLVMIGEENKVTQELIVLGIQPTNNTSATLTLTDYSPEIYTKDLDDEHIAFSANITLENLDIVKRTITKRPTIIDVSSSSGLSSQAATGTFINTTIITFSNPVGLPPVATTIEVEVILGDAVFDNNTPRNPYYTDKQSSSISILGLTTNMIYKTRARYTNNEKSVFGPWSDVFTFQVAGKSINPFNASDITITLQGTKIIVKPIVASGVAIPADHSHYIIKLYRNSSSITQDFWSTVDPANMLEVTTTPSQGTAIFDLLEKASNGVYKLAGQRISATGINYRIACRAVNNTGNYSSTSVLGSIKIKTIQ